MAFKEITRLEELGKKVTLGLKDEEFNELRDLTDKLQKWKEERGSILLNVVSNIKEYEISMDDLNEMGAFGVRDIKNTSANTIDSSSVPKEKKQRNAKTGIELYSFEKSGSGFNISRIRSDSKPPATPNMSHIAFFKKEGTIEEKLKGIQNNSQEAKNFLDSDDGKELMKEWIEWFDTKVRKYVDKKK